MGTYMEYDWDDLPPCHDHHIFFIDLIVDEIVKILHPGDLLPSRLVTLSFNYCAARWIKKTGWFVINFKYSFQFGKYLCAQRWKEIGADLDLDWQSNQSLSQSRRGNSSNQNHQNTLANLSEIMRNSNYFPFKKLYFTTEMPQSVDLTNFVAVHGKDYQELSKHFVPINLLHGNPNRHHLLQQLPLPYISLDLPTPLSPFVIPGSESCSQDEDSSSSRSQSPIQKYPLVIRGKFYSTPYAGSATPKNGHGRKHGVLALNTPSPSPSSTGGKGKKINMTCGVCGDHAKSHHFGGVSCDSCKAFFRRSVISNTYPHFLCIQQQDKCLITLSTRRLCQYCRFAKCGVIGMDKKWVLGDDERRAFQKLRQQKNEGKKCDADTWKTKNDPAIMLMYMTPNEQLTVEQLVFDAYQSRVNFPHHVIPSSFYSQNQSNKKSSIEIVGMFTTLLRRLVSYLRKLPHFTESTPSDQKTLLHHGFLEICQLGSALSFNNQNTLWPYKTERVATLQNQNSPGFDLCGEYLKNLVKPEKSLYDMQLNFKLGLQQLEADEVVILLLIIIVIFQSEREGLVEPTRVAQAQEFYLELLRKYVLWRYEPHGSKMFPKFLAKLTELRELTDTLRDYIERRAREEKYNIWKLIEQRRALAQGIFGTGEERVATETTTPTTVPPSNLKHATKPPPVTSLMFYNMITQQILLLFQDPNVEVSESDEAVAKKIMDEVLVKEIRSVFSEERFCNSFNAFNKEGENNLPVVRSIRKTNFTALSENTQTKTGFISKAEIRYWLDWWWSDVTPECDYYCIPVKGVDQGAEKEGTPPSANCAQGKSSGGGRRSTGDRHGLAGNPAHSRAAIAQNSHSPSIKDHKPTTTTTTATTTTTNDKSMSIVTKQESVSHCNQRSKTGGQPPSSLPRACDTDNFNGANVTRNLAIEHAPKKAKSHIVFIKEDLAGDAVNVSPCKNEASSQVRTPFELFRPWPKPLSNTGAKRARSDTDDEIDFDHQGGTFGYGS